MISVFHLTNSNLDSLEVLKTTNDDVDVVDAIASASRNDPNIILRVAHC